MNVRLTLEAWNDKCLDAILISDFNGYPAAICHVDTFHLPGAYHDTQSLSRRLMDGETVIVELQPVEEP